MCFSLEASVGAGVLLTSISVLTLKKTKNKQELMFASIPLIFGIQQFIEGILWLTIPRAEFQNMTLIASFSFVFIAQVIWPSWIPLSVYLFDPKSRKSVFLKYLLLQDF